MSIDRSICKLTKNNKNKNIPTGLFHSLHQHSARLAPTSIMIRIKSALNRYPSISKGIVTGFLFTASDALTQLIIQKNEKFDWRRNFQFLVLGMCWLAPNIEIWYGKLLPYITAKYLSHHSKPKKIAWRLLIDAAVSPTIMYAGFYIIKNFLFNKQEINANFKEEFKEKFIPTLLADWVLWFPANLINFWWVPVYWQGIYVGVFSFFFNMILSFISNREIQYDKQIEKQKIEAQIAHKPIPPHKQGIQQKILHTIHPKKVQYIV